MFWLIAAAAMAVPENADFFIRNQSGFTIIGVVNQPVEYRGTYSARQRQLTDHLNDILKSGIVRKFTAILLEGPSPLAQAFERALEPQFRAAPSKFDACLQDVEVTAMRPNGYGGLVYTTFENVNVCENPTLTVTRELMK